MDATGSSSVMFSAPLWTSEEQRQPLLKKTSRFSILRKRYRTTRKCFGSPAILTLLALSFLCHMCYYFFSSPTHLFPSYFDKLGSFANTTHPVLFKNLAKSSCTAALYLLFPFAGYLADTRLGHYRAITYSTRVQIPGLGLVIAGGSIVVAMEKFAPVKNIAHVFVEVGGYITLSVGLLLVLLTVVGIGANIVIFGLDQFFDTPWDDQVVYVLWYMWTSFAARWLVSSLGYILRIKHNTYLIYYSAAGGVFAIALFAVLAAHCLLIRKKDWFVTDYHRSRDDPYRIVYKITRYARRHKIFVNKEAFSDCSHEVPSGLDVCKQKYGGPFSSSMVEDVKSFFGIVKILTIASSFFYFIHISYEANDMFQQHLNPTGLLNDSMKATHVLIHDSKKILIVVLLPIYIIAIRPLVLPRMPKTVKNMGINLILSVIPILLLTIMDSVLHKKHKHLSCMLDRAHRHRLPNVSEAIAQYFQIYNLIVHFGSDCLVVAVFASLYKFICSQSPHSMKGFLVGLTFALTGFYELAVNVIAFVISLIRLYKRTMSCGTLYYTINIALGLAAVLLYACAARKYQYRRVGDADDDLDPPRGYHGCGLLGRSGGRRQLSRNLE